MAAYPSQERLLVAPNFVQRVLHVPRDDRRSKASHVRGKMRRWLRTSRPATACSRLLLRVHAWLLWIVAREVGSEEEASRYQDNFRSPVIRLHAEAWLAAQRVTCLQDARLGRPMPDLLPVVSTPDVHESKWKFVFASCCGPLSCLYACLHCSRKLSQCDGILHETGREDDGGRRTEVAWTGPGYYPTRQKRCGENTRPRCLTALTRAAAGVYVCFIQGSRDEGCNRMWPIVSDTLIRWRTAGSKTRLQLCVVHVGAACVMWDFEEHAIFFVSELSTQVPILTFLTRWLE